jgi:CRP-like cAMP-binding protein
MSSDLLGLLQTNFPELGPSTYEAVAHGPTRLLVFGPAAYAWLMDELPGFARALLAEFARRHHTTMRLLAAARHQGAMERLTLALARLASEQAGAERDAAGWCRLRVTQAQLAALAGLTRQTINEMLGALARQQRVRPVYGGLWLAP